jgi:hypothetical protein
METVKYSLNNSKYSIDVDAIKTNTNTNEIENKKKYKNTNLFDKYCIELYGEKTCILFYIDQNTIEVRMLDKIRYDINYPTRYINKGFLYNEIPNLLKNNYTVILVENILNSNTTEITSIHLPPK